jgi:hypothetical protein
MDANSGNSSAREAWITDSMAASTSRLELVDVATAEMAARGQRWKPGHAALRVLLKQAYE